MKQFILSFVFLYVTTVIMAQGIYWDIGGGFGMSSNDAQVKYSDAYGTSSDINYPRGLGFDFGGKAGYGPFELPLYLVGEVSWTLCNTFEQSYGNRKYTRDLSHIFAGPGIVYYPSEYIQVATSIGIVHTIMDHSVKGHMTDQNGNITAISSSDTGTNLGFGFNLSSAIDFGSNTSGFLLGGKFSYYDTDDLEIGTTSYGGQYSLSTVYVGIFVKYRFGKS